MYLFKNGSEMAVDPGLRRDEREQEGRRRAPTWLSSANPA